MHWAAEFGHLNTLKLLCDHFAVWTDADKVRSHFMTRMICSARSSHSWNGLLVCSLDATRCTVLRLVGTASVRCFCFDGLATHRNSFRILW